MNLKEDIRYALRVFARSPGLTLLIILILTLGIGATTGIFSILNAVLLQPLPYLDSGRLVVIWDRDIHAKGTSKLFDTYADYRNWKENSRSFADVAAVSWAPQASPSRILTGAGRTRSVFTLPVTADFFTLLGVPPMLGRTIGKSDEGRGCVAVLANDFWQSAFGNNKGVIGKPIRLDDRLCTVVGVMPPGFAFLPPEAPVSMWVLMPPPAHPADFGVGVFARLRANVSPAAAQAEVSLLHDQLHKHDLQGEKVAPVVYGLRDEFTWLTGRNLKLTLVLLFGAVTFVLLICCLNVANLLLGRAAHRGREMAIRAALGSGRHRLVRQLLTESLLMSVISSIAGAALAIALVYSFRVAHPIEMPPGTKLGISAPVLAFAGFLSIVTAVVFGLAPACRASRVNLDEVLKAGGRAASRDIRQQRFGKVLVISEVMLTVVLLTGAGLLIQTLSRFAKAPLGFEPDGLLTTPISLPPGEYVTPEQRIRFYDDLQAGLAAIAGVRDVALSSTRPIDGGGATDIVEVEGHPPPRFEKAFDTYQHTVSLQYFSTMQIPLLAGRSFNRTDSSAGDPVAVVNEALVRKYFSGEDPVGKYIRPVSHKGPWLRVVGVAGDERRTTVYQEMAWASAPIIYRPLAQNPVTGAHLIIRNAPNSRGVKAAIQRAIGAINSNIPVEDVQTVRDVEARYLSYPRFRAALAGGFAGFALLLAAVGLFGILSQMVAQRTHEIGVRMAIGAQRRDVIALVIRQGAALSGVGLAGGLLAVLIVSKWLLSLLYGVQPRDPGTLAGVSLLIAVVTLLGSYIPARRASRVDPMVALRYE